MKKILAIALLLFAIGANAQKFKSSSSYVRFYSDAPMEDIEAINEKSSSIMDVDSRGIVFVIPIVSFEFQKKLMQEHFNENYLESDKFPRAIFKGKVEGWSGDEGKSRAKAVGEMEIHGVKQNIEVEGSMTKSGEKLIIESVFPIRLEDYKIKIPKAVFYKIAEEVEVTIKFEYVPHQGN